MLLQETNFWWFVFIIVRPRNVAFAMSLIQGVSLSLCRTLGGYPHDCSYHAASSKFCWGLQFCHETYSPVLCAVVLFLFNLVSHLFVKLVSLCFLSFLCLTAWSLVSSLFRWTFIYFRICLSTGGWPFVSVSLGKASPLCFKYTI